MAVDTDFSEVKVKEEEIVKEIENGNVEMKDATACEVAAEQNDKDDGNFLNDKDDGNFLNDITLGTESPGEAVEANGDVEAGNKYTEKDAVRRVLIKSIDRKKTSDDIEDYFFDNYSDCGIEDVFTCYLPGKKKWFNGAAIITFEKEEQAQKFMKMELRKEEEIGFRQKLYRICLADNKKKREERLKKFSELKNKQEVNGSPETATTSRNIVCVGFNGKVKGVAEVQSYMNDNHENVVEVKIDKEKTFITFGDQRAADRFLGLAYVKFKGAYIHRKYGEEVKRGEKRKLEGSDQKSGYLGAVKGAQFKLKGLKNAGTNYTVIKQGLEGMGVDRKELKFVSYNVGQMEAVVRLQTARAREVVMMLNKAGFTINGDRVVAQILTGGEEDSYLQEVGKAKWNHARPKKEFRAKNDWSDY
eukprot:TRINITY_DN6293_c0_g1_i1.p1 TRINITY_DN6293_c0_g1~~TRINITY_DN6293_c0_g1_i1.p1  ORF type:complete len:469 (-),score=192.73 TRINITY_DN6293_c0_g1_i1:79-1326(-)